jgi:hypothetical protein
MKTSEQTDKIAQALAAAQAETKPLIADKVNPFFKSNYADLSNVINSVKEAAQKNGISIIQGGGEPSDHGLIVTCRIFHTSGQWIETMMVLPLAKRDAQAAGSALTYGRRYLLASLFNLATEEDDDDGASASAPDQSKRRDTASLTPILAAQIKKANEFFTSFEASKENIKATVDRFTGGRCDEVEAMMKPEAAAMINALNKKHVEQFSTVEKA